MPENYEQPDCDDCCDGDYEVSEQELIEALAAYSDQEYEAFAQKVEESRVLLHQQNRASVLSVDQPTGTVLYGDGTWPFTATVDGDDIVVRNVYTTWFGGDNDPMDNGDTWSGLKTKGHPTIQGCALPLRNLTHNLKGSPIPVLPKFTQVRVYSHATKKTVTVPLIDIGPAHLASHPGEPHAVDLTQQSFKDLGLSLSRGLGLVDYRILGGAKVGSL